MRCHFITIPSLIHSLIIYSDIIFQIQCDFGLARQLRCRTEIVNSVVSVNSRWAAPELIKGESHNELVDVYSAGVRSSRHRCSLTVCSPAFFATVLAVGHLGNASL